jgi:lysophospholipase L1-like esterase
VLPGADIVVVVIGANDATHRTPPRSFRADLRSVLAMIRDAAPDAELVLAGIPRFRGVLPEVNVLIWIAEQYARVLRGVGRAEAMRAGIRYADLARDVPPRVSDIDAVLSVDRFHPSAAGYRLCADVIAEALDRPKAAARPLTLRTNLLAES